MNTGLITNARQTLAATFIFCNELDIMSMTKQPLAARAPIAAHLIMIEIPTTWITHQSNENYTCFFRDYLF
jgi:hypothetical protein